MDKRLNTIRRRFNRSAASSYDTHANVQRVMSDSLAELVIGHASPPQKEDADILEIGCGTGALTVKLRTAWPNAKITALDVAPAMLEAAKRRIDGINELRAANEAVHTGSANCTADADKRDRAARADQAEREGSAIEASLCQSAKPRVHFLLADAEAWAPEAASGSYDLVVSNACFQWFAHPRETLCELKRLLRPGGQLAFTTFGPQTFRELHSAFEAAYLARGLTPQRHGLSLRSPAEWQNLLTEAGFVDIRYDRSTRTDSYPTVSDFLHSVKAVGASASEASDSRGLGRQRRLFTEMFHAYETKYSCPGGIFATYDLLLVHAAAPL